MDLCWKSNVYTLKYAVWVGQVTPRSKLLLISWLQSPPAVILEPKKIKGLIVSIVSPSICHEVMGLDAMIWDLVLTNQHLPHVATITGPGKACDSNHCTRSYFYFLKKKTTTGKKHCLFYWGNWNDEMYMWRCWKPICYYGGRVCWRVEPTQKKQQ